MHTGDATVDWAPARHRAIWCRSATEVEYNCRTLEITSGFKMGVRITTIYVKASRKREVLQPEVHDTTIGTRGE